MNAKLNGTQCRPGRDGEDMRCPTCGRTVRSLGITQTELLQTVFIGTYGSLFINIRPTAKRRFTSRHVVSQAAMLCCILQIIASKNFTLSRKMCAPHYSKLKAVSFSHHRLARSS
jgi:hypothetical protein